MSFLARLATDLITVEAGATTPTSIEIINRDDAADQFELSIEGLDPEWTAVPVPVVSIEARETQEEKIFFKPPRVSESSAGNYPFVLRVRSLTSGEARTVQGVLTVKPFNHLSIELGPKKGYISPISRHNVFEATLVNLGNTEHTVQLFGSDPEEACAFEVDQEQISLGPGQQKTVMVTVNPTKGNVFSGSRLFGFNVSARSIEQPSVVAVAQAQLEQRPLMSIGTMSVLVAVLFVVGLWIYLIPAKPSLHVTADRYEITKGESFNVSWTTTGQPSEVHISSHGEIIYDGSEAKGSVPYTPKFAVDSTANSIDIEGYVEKDGQKYNLAKTLAISVKEPLHVDDPKIEVFKLDKTDLHVGDVTTVNYRVADPAHTKVVLLPMGTQLDPNLDQTQITANDVNTKEYTLVATNSAGVSVRKKVSVTIAIASKASIIAFSADPVRIDAVEGDVTLSWQVSNSVRNELSAGSITQTVDALGSQKIHLTKTTVITLTAIDDAGVRATKTIKIVVAPALPPVDPGGPLPGELHPGTTTGTVNGGP